ncbi:MAG TPA: hypothetical protein VEO37_02125, partial [Thermoanaerobaculia bacterium]|nr:hypothetical protein [Thermoanaerobaculia bacterium]
MSAEATQAQPADSFRPAGQHLSAGGLTLEGMRNGWPLAALSEETVRSLARAARLPPLPARLLVLRGVESGEEAHSFLHLTLDALHDPFLMYGVEEAADILS